MENLGEHTHPLLDAAAVDARGTRHESVVSNPRIVSLVPSLTELLFALDLDAQIVGRTTFCVHPGDRVAAIPRVGGTKKVNLERLRALAPSHVIVNIDENSKSQVDEMANFVPHIIVTHPLAPADNVALYRLLGTVFNRRQQAERLCQHLQRRLTALSDVGTLPTRKVLYLIWRDPWMTVSPDTYISRTLSLFNWQTLPHDCVARYPEVNLTSELCRDIDVILFSSEPYPFKQKHLAEVRLLSADVDVRLAMIDGEMTSWYGDRAIKGLDYLGKFSAALFPD